MAFRTKNLDPLVHITVNTYLFPNFGIHFHYPLLFTASSSFTDVFLGVNGEKKALPQGSYFIFHFILNRKDTLRYYVRLVMAMWKLLKFSSEQDVMEMKSFR